MILYILAWFGAAAALFTAAAGVYAILRLVARDWRRARSVIAATRDEDQAMALGNDKLPAGNAVAPVPQASAPPAPAAPPGLAGEERAALARLAGIPWHPQARQNGRDYADCLRELMPGLGDAELARIVLAHHVSVTAFTSVMPSAAWALRCYTDQLACAALDLTALDRTETPR